MFFFNKEEVYMGYSMGEFSKVRTILESEGIKYVFKVINPSGKWLGTDTSRGNFGNSGLNKNYERQYVVAVKKKDVENAKFLIHRFLYS